MEKHFDFRNSESKLYDYWLKNNLFSPFIDSKKPVYCTLNPPPNLRVHFILDMLSTALFKIF